MIGFDDLAESKEFRQFSLIVRELTGVLFALVSPDATRRKLLYPQEVAATPLCRLIHSNPKGLKACFDSDNIYLSKAARQNKGFHYFCHAGLLDMVMPVVINNEHIATLISGQMLHQPHSERGFQRIKRKLAHLGFATSDLKKAYYASPYCSLEKFKIIMNLYAFFAEHFGEISWRLKHVQQDILPVQNAQKFIHDHFQERITLRDIARSASLSGNYFSSMFHKMTGTVVKRYLQVIRVNAAKKLLTLSSERITDIAFNVGFINLADFNRVFKKIENCSPHQYRQSYKGQSSAQVCYAGNPVLDAAVPQK